MPLWQESGGRTAVEDATGISFAGTWLPPTPSSAKPPLPPMAAGLEHGSALKGETGSGLTDSRKASLLKQVSHLLLCRA